MDELSSYLNARKLLYGFLGDFFYTEPTKKYFDAVLKYLPVVAAMCERGGDTKAAEGMALIEGYVWNEDSEDALAKEFTSVFLVSDVFKGAKPVTPHESVYLSHGGLSMQEERDKVLEKFYAAGVKKQDGFTEPEDHIKSEFDFMAVMTAHALELSANDDGDGFAANITAQKAFMDEHISRWCSALCADVVERGVSDYFKGMALVCAGYAEADSKFLDEIFTAVQE